MFRHGIESRFSLKGLMNFVDLTVFNSTGAQIDNINAGGVDVPAGSSVTATLTNTECLAVCQLAGVAVMKNAVTDAQKSAAAALILQSTALETAIAAAEAAEAGGITIHREAAWAALDSAYNVSD
jgi:hypothetical protein